MLMEKIKALNPICRMVSEHRTLCADVVAEGQKVLQRRADQAAASLPVVPWGKL